MTVLAASQDRSLVFMQTEAPRPPRTYALLPWLPALIRATHSWARQTVTGTHAVIWLIMRRAVAPRYRRKAILMCDRIGIDSATMLFPSATFDLNGMLGVSHVLLRLTRLTSLSLARQHARTKQAAALSCDSWKLMRLTYLFKVESRIFQADIFPSG